MFITPRKFDAIRGVLVNEWDPVGVRDDVDSRREYDKCAGLLCALLVSGWNAAQIAAYLADVEMNELAMPPRDAQELQDCAERLYREWHTHVSG